MKQKMVNEAKVVPGQGLSGEAKVEVKFEGDDEWTVLFTFFEDEISFKKEELIGLSENDARDLKYLKDVAYIRS